jgi:hypothetical protein
LIEVFAGTKKMDPLAAFGIGMIGAVAPEIVRLYELRSQGGQDFSVFYVVISLIFAALGGLVALVLPATTLWGAFYAGISTPVLISTALKKGLAPKSQIRSLPEGSQKRGSPSLLRFLSAL